MSNVTPHLVNRSLRIRWGYSKNVGFLLTPFIDLIFKEKEFYVEFFRSNKIGGFVRLHKIYFSSTFKTILHLSQKCVTMWYQVGSSSGNTEFYWRCLVQILARAQNIPAEVFICWPQWLHADAGMSLCDWVGSFCPFIWWQK